MIEVLVRWQGKDIITWSLSQQKLLATAYGCATTPYFNYLLISLPQVQ